MIMLCNAIIECGRRRRGLLDAPLDMEYDNNRIEGQQQDRGPTTGQRANNRTEE